MCLPLSLTWIDIWLTNFSSFHVSSLIASPLSTISCSILTRHSSVCCQIPTQPRHPAVTYPKCPVASTTFSHVCRLRTHHFCWIVGPCCVLLAVAFHGLPTHRFQELQIPRIITFKTSHTACLHCTCWRQQQKVIGAVKLADRNSSHPPHVQLGSILRMVSPQAHFSKWHNFSSVVLAPDRTIRRSPGSLHLKVVYNPCTVSYHPAPQHMIRSNFCLVFLCDGFTKCPKLSLNRQIFSFSTLQAPFRAFWRCSHDQSCGLTPFDRSVCHT